jgi:hypothetical protein
MKCPVGCIAWDYFIRQYLRLIYYGVNILLVVGMFLLMLNGEVRENRW